MDFIIRKNSTLPNLVLKQVIKSDINYEEFNKMMSNCVCTFSMIDIETGVYIIANRSAGVYIKDKVNESCDNPYEYYIYYKWNEKDTRKTGVYKGEFLINFFDEDGNSCEKVIVPIYDDLFIHIEESITKTTVRNI